MWPRSHQSLKIITQPAVEPVALSLVKLQARIDPDVTTEDTLIAAYITAARKWVEQASDRQLITATYRLSVDRFPSPFCRPYGYGVGAVAGVDQQPILGWNVFDPDRSAFRLPYPPAQAVSSLQYLDPNGTLQTLDPSLYTVDTDSEPARVVPVVGTNWPDTQVAIEAVQLTYTAGYGDDGSAVPQTYNVAILQLATHWYTNRASVAPGTMVEVPMGTKALVFLDRVKDF
jgi:hypothetical protein